MCSCSHSSISSKKLIGLRRSNTLFFPCPFYASGATSNIGFGGACGAGQPVTHPNLTVEQAKQTCCDIRANGSECTGFSFVVPVI